MTTVAEDYDVKMAEFRRKVRAEIIKAGQHRSDYTRAQQNATLAELGLEPIYEPQFVPVEVTRTTRTTVRVDDCPDQASARARVAAMDGEEIGAALRTVGGYVAHRVLDVNEDPDPLAWIATLAIEERSYRSEPARRAGMQVAEECDARGVTCRARSPRSTYHCSRGREHPGVHIATDGMYVCEGAEAVWQRGEGQGQDDGPRVA